MIRMHTPSERSIVERVPPSLLIMLFAVSGLFVTAIACTAFWPRNPKTTDELLGEGRFSLSRGDTATAVRCAETLIKSAPQSSVGWKLLADTCARDGNSVRAMEALNEYGRLQPEDAGRTGIQIASNWMKQNRIRPAIQALRLAETFLPTSSDVYRLQAQMAAVTGHSREVARCLIELLKCGGFTRNDLIVVTSINPCITDPDRLAKIRQQDAAYKSPLLATVLQELDLNHVEAAIQVLAEITASQPDDLEAQGLLGLVYADLEPGRFLEWHSRIPNECKDDSQIWLARGKWLNKQGDSKAAIRCLFEAFQREPELLAANTLLGQLLVLNNSHTSIAEAFTDRGRRLQRIIDYSSRMKDPRADEWTPQFVADLEAVGRLWEAWGWCVVLEQGGSHPPVEITEARERLGNRLNPQLPRTNPAQRPGKELDWEQFPLPDWSRFKMSAIATSNHLTHVQENTIQFEDRAHDVGLDFRFVNSYSPQEGRRIFESMGGGVAVLDFDLDGWPDLYFPQGKTLPIESEQGPSDVLYRNHLGKRFQAVTETAGIHETMYSQGVAAGDYDNDGFSDVYVANLGRNRLYRNNGDGTFRDATDEAGLTQNSWTMSCAIADLDGDGLPELFDVNYVQSKDLLTGICLDAHGRPTVCRPTVFDPATDTVALNLGDGRFREQQHQCGLDLPQGMGLGLVIADFNDDDRLDVFVANDMTANYLLINEPTDRNHALYFHDEGSTRGVAVDHNGLAQACMGVACADVNRDGCPDLFVTNFARESDTLYLSQPGGFYQDQTQRAGLREPSFEPLGFGAQFFDADHDGWYDLAYVNGHIDKFSDDPFQMKAQLFRGGPDSRFVELFAPQAGELFDKLRLGRAMALLDWNRDGRIDFVATDLEDSVLLAENRTDTKAAALRLKLVGTKSSRDAIGAKVTIQLTPSDKRVVQLTAGDGYQSCNERFIHVGVGNARFVSLVEIRWASGAISRAENLGVDVNWLIIEGRPDAIREVSE